MTRDLVAERKAYYGYGPASGVTPLQRKHRKQMASRQKARTYFKHIRKDQEVNHINGNPLDNRMSNLEVISRHENRSQNKHKTQKKNPQK
jgi:hypothetical protein